ncbi:hypothetical protein HYZ99_01500 [Candidatus Peregrinibacteria bacterium]|nr:hypothetical protein [Candidatus Peregrinibacteria bacterium]
MVDMDDDPFGREAQDMRRATAELIEQAFFRDDADALRQLHDADQDLAVLVQEAKEGTPGALLDLGESFLFGRGPVPQMLDLAEDFLGRAARAGSQRARKVMESRGWVVPGSQRRAQDVTGETDDIGGAVADLLFDPLQEKPKRRKRR